MQEVLVSSTCTLLIWPSGAQDLTPLDSGADLRLRESMLRNSLWNASSPTSKASFSPSASISTISSLMAAIWSSSAALCCAVRARTSAAALLATRLALETDDSTCLADSPGVTSSYSTVSFRLDARDWDPESLPLTLIVKMPDVEPCYWSPQATN